MCGIAGVINTKEENKELAKKMFKSILLANEVRGKDSTGILAIDRDTGNYSLFKDTIPSSLLLKRKKFRQVEADIWIGHTRLATTGDVNIRNAHPLNRKDIFLVHNGVITNHLEVGIELDFKHQVDSEVLIPIIEREDWNLLEKIDGSANFIAWNKSKGRLYIERHDNPLYCLTLKDMGVIMFSSVKDVLDFLAGHYGNGDDEVFEFTDDTLIVLDMKGNVIEKREGLKFKEEKIYLPSTEVPIKRPTYYEFDDKDYHDDEYSNYDKSKYGRPYYNYDDEDNYDEEDYVKLIEGERENFCEACGVEIGTIEKEAGLQEWGFPLCYDCLNELDDVNDKIVNGEVVDFDHSPYDKFKGIVGAYLP